MSINNERYLLKLADLQDIKFEEVNIGDFKLDIVKAVFKHFVSYRTIPKPDGFCPRIYSQNSEKRMAEFVKMVSLFLERIGVEDEFYLVFEDFFAGIPIIKFNIIKKDVYLKELLTSCIGMYNMDMLFVNSAFEKGFMLYENVENEEFFSFSIVNLKEDFKLLEIRQVLKDFLNGRIRSKHFYNYIDRLSRRFTYVGSRFVREIMTDIHLDILNYWDEDLAKEFGKVYDAELADKDEIDEKTVRERCKVNLEKLEKALKEMNDGR